MKRYAILIGSSRFDPKSGLDPLRCPENDVDGMHEIVAAQELGAFTETFPLKNVPHHKVIDQIEETLEVATGDDQILIYYSGHGKTDLPGDLYLTTSNTKEGKLFSSSVPVMSLRTLIRNSRCKKIMMILDCCFAGAAGQAFTKSSKDEKLKELARGNGIYLLTATTAEDTAIEKKTDDYSLLTKHIINGIKSGAAARQGATHISIEDVYSYANLHVTAEGHQKPMRWALNVRGEELILAAVRVQTDRLRYLEDQILGAWARRLTRKIRIDAQQIISECYAQSGLHETKLQLLENLFNGKLESGEFQDEWDALGVVKSKPKIRELYEKTKSYTLDALGVVELKPKIQPLVVATKKEMSQEEIEKKLNALNL